MDKIKEIITMINQDSNSPFKCIGAYQGGNTPPKPYATYYELEPSLDDITGVDNSIFVDNTKESVRDSAEYYGEYPIQFDIYSENIEGSRLNSKNYWEFLIFKMREEFHRRGIGITTHTSPKPVSEFIAGEYEYRRVFRVTFEFDTTTEKISQMAKKLEVTANTETFDVNLKTN